MTLTISFPGTEQTTLEKVGGKGYSLIRMVEAGLPVPPGAVLTTEFFAPWFDEIQASATWTEMADATPDKWGTICNELKDLCPALPLTATQQQALEDLRKNLAAMGDDVLFAVRSSSPEEDLATPSFAGGYETRLGVRPADLEDAVRHCFASSLDERVFVYKKEHGFDVLSPRIAVVVQQQIDSEVAGVGFSLNPLTNDYDEAVIDANWGLGESVVAGLVSPDHFIVNKVDQQVMEKKLGAKQVSIWLGPDGDTIEREGHRSAEFTLNDAQLDELTEVMCRIEAFFEKPIDIEWAYASGKLYVLQARPITTYVPLPPEMVTKPGERRRLYADAALSQGMTINAPISPMGLNWMVNTFQFLFESKVGRPVNLYLPPEEALLFPAGGRTYLNLSNIMWLVNLKALSNPLVRASDALVGEILANVDAKRYRTTRRPSWMKLRILRFMPMILWRMRRPYWNIFKSILSPERAHRTYQRTVNAYKLELTKNVDYSLPFDEFQRTYRASLTRDLEVVLPALIAFLFALGSVDLVVGKKSDEVKALLEKLKLGFTGDIVVEMGIALFRLAKLLDRSDFEDLTRLAERVENRQMSAEFLSAWDTFVADYGCRGPMEMDLARPHYGNDPGLALRQMSFMSVNDEDFDPEVPFKRHIEERQQAYEALMSRSSWLRRMLLRRFYRIIDLFMEARDMPKHFLSLLNYAIRQRILIEGKRLVQEGRLDTAEDVFDLTPRDLESAALDPSLDLREVRQERTRFLKILEAHVTTFPRVIDSRGRILRPPPRQEKNGELSGMAVSPGVVTGPIKVLHNPHEKPIDKGDVLVAYATDPGWTPLFVNAAAVVLEVGGILQHGALIAREYGKPCVVGIDQVITKLHDGQMVEVDGTTGVIRIL